MLTIRMDWGHGLIWEMYTTPLSTLSINGIIYETFYMEIEYFMAISTVLCHTQSSITYFSGHIGCIMFFSHSAIRRALLFSKVQKKRSSTSYSLGPTATQIHTPNLKVEYVQRNVYVAANIHRKNTIVICMFAHSIRSSTWISPPIWESSHCGCSFHSSASYGFFRTFFPVFVSFMSHRLVYNATIIEKYYKFKWVLLYTQTQRHVYLFIPQQHTNKKYNFGGKRGKFFSKFSI